LKSGTKIELHVGLVEEIMTLKINGRTVGVQWHPPYQYDVTDYMKAGVNVVEVSVAVNWANRLIGDEQEAVDFEWGPDRGSNGRAIKAYPDWFLKNEARPSIGRKGFLIWYYYRKDSKTQPAGLMGPVLMRR